LEWAETDTLFVLGPPNTGRMTDAGGIQAVDGRPEREETLVTAHTSAPGRTVLTERGNTDGWIAGDLAVEPPR
jgi:hypothetical protein